jgi:hypothetical protein
MAFTAKKVSQNVSNSGFISASAVIFIWLLEKQACLSTAVPLRTIRCP